MRIKRADLPEENKKDIRDIPKVVRNNVTLVVVNHMDQVIPLALSKDITIEDAGEAPDPLLDLLISRGEGEESQESQAPAVH